MTPEIEAMTGELFAEVLERAALRLVHDCKAPMHAAAFALACAMTRIADRELGREKTAQWLREVADLIERGEEDRTPPATVN